MLSLPDSQTATDETLVAVTMTVDELLDLQWWLGLDSSEHDEYNTPEVVAQIRAMSHVALADNDWL